MTGPERDFRPFFRVTSADRCDGQGRESSQEFRAWFRPRIPSSVFVRPRTPDSRLALSLCLPRDVARTSRQATAAAMIRRFEPCLGCASLCAADCDRQASGVRRSSPSYLSSAMRPSARHSATVLTRPHDNGSSRPGIRRDFLRERHMRSVLIEGVRCDPIPWPTERLCWSLYDECDALASSRARICGW